MNDYNYLDAVCDDVRKYIEESRIDFTSSTQKDELAEDLYYKLWNEDSVTGNASGSYTFNTYTAEEYLCHNWDLLKDALFELGESDVNILEQGPEWCDLTIRCYLLSEAISIVLDELMT